MTTIVEAATQPTTIQAALTYTKLGFSVIPLNGKQPAIRWQKYQTAAATPGDILNWQTISKLHNIGIVCRYGYPVVLDFDGMAGYTAFRTAFPQLSETFTVATGSGNGMHVYLRCAAVPATFRVMNIPNVGNIELRSDGCYVVAPPSIHPDTLQPYRVERAQPVLEVPSLDRVRAWMRGFLRQQPQPTPIQTRPPTDKDRRAIRFAEAALTGEAYAVRAAAEGNRNNQLNRAAYSLGQLVGDGWLSRGRVEMALLAAALDCGLDEPSAWRTIQSGLNAGVNNPRSRRYGR